MLNKEKYKEKIEQILVDGEVLAFDKKNNEIIPCCFLHHCSDCKFLFSDGKECSENRREWLNSEYVEPEVDWSKVPVDTPILVRDSENDIWKRRYFAGNDDGKVYTWTHGTTSWSASDEDCFCKWSCAKLVEAVENPQEKYGGEKMP